MLFISEPLMAAKYMSNWSYIPIPIIIEAVAASTAAPSVIAPA